MAINEQGLYKTSWTLFWGIAAEWGPTHWNSEWRLSLYVVLDHLCVWRIHPWGTKPPRQIVWCWRRCWQTWSSLMRKFSSEANLVADVAAVFHYDDDLCKKRSSHSSVGDNAKHIATLRNISNAMYILELCVISRCVQVMGSMKSRWFRTQQRGC